MGLDGAIIGMTTFGASAPAKDLFKKYGFTDRSTSFKPPKMFWRVTDSEAFMQPTGILETEKAVNPLKHLLKFGQSIWLDYIRRDLLTGGELKRLIDEDGFAA